VLHPQASSAQATVAAGGSFIIASFELAVDYGVHVRGGIDGRPIGLRMESVGAAKSATSAKAQPALIFVDMVISSG
jgi:hypothetical protein